MKRCDLKSLGLISLVAIASATMMTHSSAADIEVLPSRSKPSSAPSAQGKLPKATPGFIPATLEAYPFPVEGGRNVFGKDERIPMNSSKYPWSAIGRVEAINGNQIDWTCTGTLIGKNLVITNAHCILDEDKQQITTNKIRFRPNLIDGKASAEAFASRIIPGTTDPRRDRGNDWAFLVLDQPLGETFGWLGFAIADLSDLDSLKNKLILAGYSSDFPKEKPAETAGVHDGCSIRGFGSQPGVVFHDCDMMAGASGGPMFVVVREGAKLYPIIIALNAAHRTPANQPSGSQESVFSSKAANMGVYAATWASKAEEVLKVQQ